MLSYPHCHVEKEGQESSWVSMIEVSPPQKEQGSDTEHDFSAFVPSVVVQAKISNRYVTSSVYLDAVLCWIMLYSVVQQNVNVSIL